MIKSEYNAERAVLASRCAKALGLRPVSPLVYEYAVKASEMPNNLCDDGNCSSVSESSLLSMGVVYTFGGMMTFIDASGHTYFVPNHPAFRRELEECGYTICGRGKSSPDFGYPMESDGLIEMRPDKFSPEYYEAAEREKKARDKATLPAELAEKVAKLEGRNITGYGTYPYDVFAEGKFTRGFDIGNDRMRVIVGVLGYDSIVTRKIMAIFGTEGEEGLSHIPETVDGLEGFVECASHHPVLSDSYFDEGGLYDQLSSEPGRTR